VASNNSDCFIPDKHTQQQRSLENNFINEQNKLSAKHKHLSPLKKHNSFPANEA